MAKQMANFERMNVAELIKIRDELEEVLNKKAAEERAELQARLDALSVFQGGNKAAPRGKMPRMGKTNGGNRAHPLKGRKVAVKYRGPDGETWSGRGLAPRWLTALEQKGKKRESYLV